MDVRLNVVVRYIRFYMRFLHKRLCGKINFAQLNVLIKMSRFSFIFTCRKIITLNWTCFFHYMSFTFDVKVIWNWKCEWKLYEWIAQQKHDKLQKCRIQAQKQRQKTNHLQKFKTHRVASHNIEFNQRKKEWKKKNNNKNKELHEVKGRYVLVCGEDGEVVS